MFNTTYSFFIIYNTTNIFSQHYLLCCRYLPVQRFIDCVTEENDIEKAEKISYIFNLNLQQLLEHCGDLMVSRGSYHSGKVIENTFLIVNFYFALITW